MSRLKRPLRGGVEVWREAASSGVVLFSLPWFKFMTSVARSPRVKKARSTIAYRDEIRNEEKLNDYYSQVEVGEVHFSNVKSAFAFKMKERMKGLGAIRKEAKWSNMNNVLIANAFYMPNRNTIVLPIGLLQEIFFSSGRPNYINYGSLGSIVGHEFTHAFDNAVVGSSPGATGDLPCRAEVANTNDLAGHFERTLKSRWPHIKIYIFILDLDPLQTFVGVKI
ncbi:neprilysin [Trichonephila clavipes]|nr:neprilysin [Trichonephila clavipes]